MFNPALNQLKDIMKVATAGHSFQPLKSGNKVTKLELLNLAIKVKSPTDLTLRLPRRGLCTAGAGLCVGR